MASCSTTPRCTPLVMRGPGVPERACAARCPAIPADDCGTGRRIRHLTDGISLPLLAGEHRGDDAPLSYAESEFGARHFGWRPIHAVRDGTWKYIDGPAPELYQLIADPAERDNRQAERTATSGALAGALTALIAKAGPASSAQAAATDRETAERLRSLGYVSGHVTLGAGEAGGAGAGDPKHEIARYEQYVTIFNDGLAALETGRFAAAEATFHRLAIQFPRAFEAHQYLARALRPARHCRGDRRIDVAIALAAGEAVCPTPRMLRRGAVRSALDRVAEEDALSHPRFYGALTGGPVALAAAQLPAPSPPFAMRSAERIWPRRVTAGAARRRAGDRDGAQARRALDGARRWKRRARPRATGNASMTRRSEGRPVCLIAGRGGVDRAADEAARRSEPPFIRSTPRGPIASTPTLGGIGRRMSTPRARRRRFDRRCRRRRGAAGALVVFTGKFPAGARCPDNAAASSTIARHARRTAAGRRFYDRRSSAPTCSITSNAQGFEPISSDSTSAAQSLAGQRRPSRQRGPTRRSRGSLVGSAVLRLGRFLRCALAVNPPEPFKSVRRHHRKSADRVRRFAGRPAVDYLLPTTRPEHGRRRRRSRREPRRAWRGDARLLRLSGDHARAAGDPGAARHDDGAARGGYRAQHRSGADLT